MTTFLQTDASHSSLPGVVLMRGIDFLKEKMADCKAGKTMKKLSKIFIS